MRDVIKIKLKNICIYSAAHLLRTSVSFAPSFISICWALLKNIHDLKPFAVFFVSHCRPRECRSVTNFRLEIAPAAKEVTASKCRSHTVLRKVFFRHLKTERSVLSKTYQSKFSFWSLKRCHSFAVHAVDTCDLISIEDIDHQCVVLGCGNTCQFRFRRRRIICDARTAAAARVRDTSSLQVNLSTPHWMVDNALSLTQEGWENVIGYSAVPFRIQMIIVGGLRSCLSWWSQ